jgi:hypothetical protein
VSGSSPIGTYSDDIALEKRDFSDRLPSVPFNS